MNQSAYISVREAAQLLGVSEKRILDLIDTGELHAYQIAGQFLRLKRSEVLALQQTGEIENEMVQFPYSRWERLADFFRYNDFYLITALLAGAIIYVVFFQP